MSDIETPINETLIEKFPDMYHGKGSIFQAVYELKRLIAEIEKVELAGENGIHAKRPRSMELAFAVRDIEQELLNHIKFNILDKEAEITFDIGEMNEDKFHRLLNLEEKLHYPYEAEVMTESCKYVDFSKEDDIIAPNKLY